MNRYYLILPDKHIIWNIIQVTAVFKPRSSGGDMIGSAFTLDLDQYSHFFQIATIPLIERF